jgi:hypothetical protein
MFDSLADRIKQDENFDVNTTQRIIRYAVVLGVSVLLFGGLYFGVRMLN